MENPGWRSVVPESSLAAGLAELFDEFERYGWYARSRVGEHGIRFWPDGGRGRQFIVDMRYPVNEHKLDNYGKHTGIDLKVESKGGNR